VSEETNERRKVEITSSVTVGELAELLELPPVSLIGELFKNGIVATINQKIDADTAQIIIDELKLSVEIVSVSDSVATERLKDRPIGQRAGKGWRDRSPVVAIMGHVDHGKTSLLDKILKLSVASGEAGGITQHIAAYQSTYEGKSVTFLDTPGHEAFSALRQHGAALTDMAVIVVAADDGVKPQTLEALRFASEQSVKIIVAITKIDKPDADLSKVKQDLVNAGQTPEEWGGDTVIAEVSSKTGEGMDKLLEIINLVAEVEELKADYDSQARGIVIESHTRKGVGSLVKVLITRGEIKKGDNIVVGSSYGKVRILKSWSGEDIDSAGPSTPVQISGLKSLPGFGDELNFASNDRDARKAAESASSQSGSAHMNSEELLRVMSRRNELSVMPIMVKADVAGSLRSVVDSIQLIATGEVEAKVIGSGVGDVTESDIALASSTKATIFCFNVGVSRSIERLAKNSGVKVRTYKIIYELIDEVKTDLSKLLVPEVKDTVTGRLIVKGVFRTTENELVCGGEVTKGSISKGSRARVMRGDKQIGEAEISSVQERSQEVREVNAGTMCGLKLKPEGKFKLLEEDRLEVYKREIIEKTL
jgi:translation initiation factor IF-2